jgi:hypothetical protein
MSDDPLAKFKREENSRFWRAARSGADRETLMNMNELNDAVTYAQRGDYEPIAEYIERGGDLPQELREFIARFLRGKVKRLNNRPPTRAAWIQRGRTARLVAQKVWQGLGIDTAIDRVAEELDVNKRTVQRAWTEWRGAFPNLAKPLSDDIK